MGLGTTLKIAFDAKKVQRGLAGIKNSFHSIGRAAAGIAKFGSAVAAIGIAGVAALGATVVKLDEIGAAGRAGDRRLQSITKQMGLFGDSSESVANRLIDAADAQAQLTGIDPQLVQTKLMTFKELAKTAGEVGGAFDRATAAALDMEAAGFGEASQNAVQLGKALNDPIKGITSLARSGITFTKVEKEMIAGMVATGKQGQAMNMVLKAIETQVGGTAAASATASGRMRKSLQLVVESFAEEMSIGFDKIPDQFQSIMPKLMEFGSMAGKIASDAISEALLGDTTKIQKMGEYLGLELGAAMEAGYQKAAPGLFKTMMRGIEDINPIRRAYEQEGRVGEKEAPRWSEWNTPSFGELYSANRANLGLDARRNEILGRGNTTPTYTGTTESPGQIAAREAVFRASVDRLVKAQEETARNTKEGSKF